ncbi:MAG: M20/M25/M40 family metallo-hydrolase, partial [Mailhella sp.]|nr:M20/M25/M40 family metallo-hydrolase [Mailhella sp.]
MSDLVKVRSVSHTAGENEAADFIYAVLAKEQYFREHPGDLLFVQCETGGLKRKAVLAYVKAGRPTGRTVLLNGHFDVVDTDVCGDLADTAFDVEAYTAAIGARDIPRDAREDLDSGNWAFGRGVMDMKAGIALHMACIAEMARRRDELGVNLVFLGVPDEEGNSAGMRGALPGLCAFARERGLDFVAALSGEPAFWTSSTTESSVPERIFYTGTTGKIMPMFFCVGREAHVGYAFDGVDRSLIAAGAVCRVEFDRGLRDGRGPDAGTPPICLGLRGLRDSYSVTLPERAVAYFNILNVSRTPLEVLGLCREVAREALEKTLARIREAGERFRIQSGRPDCPVPAWEPRVYSIREVMDMLAERVGREKAAAMLDEFAASLPADMDEREKGIAIADRLISLVNLKGPAVVVGFLPPYYPQRINLRKTEKEKRLRSIMEEACDEISRRLGGGVRLIECFSGIMDLSYVGFQGGEADLHALADNMPGWGTVFSLPMDDLLSLDIPIANMGPSGKDAHKDTERLELGYSFDIAPEMLLNVLKKLA